MSTQIPNLDKGEMAAAERANVQITEQIIVMMAKFLRENAQKYPLNLRKQLSEPNAETKVDISFGAEKLFSATLGADNRLKKTQINKITDSQTQCLQEALSKQKGETLDTQTIQNMRVLVNGQSLFEVKNGKVIQNDLPADFRKAINAMIKPKLLEVSLEATTLKPSGLLENPPKPSGLKQQASANTNSISNVIPNEPNKAPISQQEQLNRDLITEAKKLLTRLFPTQPAGDRQWKHEKYSLTKKDGVFSVYSAETNSTIRQEGDLITGNATQKDVNALNRVNAVIDQKMGKSAATGIEVEH